MNRISRVHISDVHLSTDATDCLAFSNFCRTIFCESTYLDSISISSGIDHPGWFSIVLCGRFPCIIVDNSQAGNMMRDLPTDLG